MFEVAPLLAEESHPSTNLPPNLYQDLRDAITFESVILGTFALVASPISLTFVSGETDLWRKIYDYLCTFDQEVEYVWLRPNSVGKYLFILNRYLPIPSTVLTYLVTVAKVPMSTAACNRLYIVITWLVIAEALIAQVILYLRTIALWARNRWILWSLAILAMCTFIPCIVISKIYADSFDFDHPDSHSGCLLAHENQIIFVDYVVILFSETIIVFLTLIRAYKHLRYSSSWWVHQLYESGIIFYFYLLAFTVLNAAFNIAAPVTLKMIFVGPQMALHSIFCSRVIFMILSQQRNLDDANSDTLYLTDGIIMSSILDTYATRDEFLSRRESQYSKNLP